MEDEMSEEQSSQETHEVENNQPGQAGVPEGEIIPGETGRDRTDNEKLDDAALRFMADAAYAVAGFAGLVGERARAFYDEQRAEYAKTHPDVESPGAKEFLEQLGSHLNRFVDEISRGFHDLSDKGREFMNTRPESSEAEKTGAPVSGSPESEKSTAEHATTEPNGEEYGEEYRQPGNE